MPLMPFDGDHETRFLSSLPAALTAEFVANAQRAQAAYQKGELGPAIEMIAGAYDLLVEGQPHQVRFHKGWPLHQLGLWRLEYGEPSAARSSFLLAFVEDVLTRQEHSPDTPDELSGPAAQMLVYNNLGVSGVALAELSRALRTAQATGTLYQTPAEALQRYPLPESTLPVEIDPYVPEWRELGVYAAGLRKRVFISGFVSH